MMLINVDDDGHGDQPVVEPPFIESQPHLDDVRKSTREPHPFKMYPTIEFVLLTEGGKLDDFQQAMSHEKCEEWYNVVQDEMKFLNGNHTNDLAKLSNKNRVLKSKCVYKLTLGEDGQLPRFKAMIVLRGYERVVKVSSIRVVLSLAASMNLDIEQLDVKIAFLHGDL